MILLGHPTGNANFRAASRAFHSLGMLRELDSCICWNPNSPLAHLLPKSLRAQLARRAFTDIPLHLQHCHPFREALRLTSGNFYFDWLHQHEKGLLSFDAIYHSFDRHVAARLCSLTYLSAVYAYEDAALKTFSAAKMLGLACLYDLPYGYWRSAQELFQEERDLKPEWAASLFSLGDSPDKLKRKDAELSLADVVIVPSQFVYSTLSASPVSSARIKIVPFGSPPPISKLPEFKIISPLRVLYVGSIGQRKGISYALEAIDMLQNQVSLTLIGKPTARNCPPISAALERHSWIPSLPHHMILEQMRQHDVLLFPTLFDGFGLVMTEALSQGLPVITTANSGAAECIRNGVEGFVVPIRNSQAIAERLQQFIDAPDLLYQMRNACLRRAAELSWTQYEIKLRQAISPFFS